MSKVVTYSNNPKGKFCQIKLDDGKRILISIAQPGIKIFKLGFFGTIPVATIFEISTLDLASDKYNEAIQKIVKQTGQLDPLDSLKELLISCKSIDEVKEKLTSVFKEI